MYFKKLYTKPNIMSVIKEFPVLIEISTTSGQVKYEYKDGKLHVDRFLSTPMIYPCNYGFIPNTIGGDGDPVDVLLHASHPILPGAMIKARAIGALVTEDESGEDLKVLALPNHKIDSLLSNISHYDQLPELLLRQIEHFFMHYKDLEKNKWVKVKNWIGPEEDFGVISESFK
jgi:inorganic pyrophosphatase